MKDSSITVRTARWSATHPWRAISLWLVFVVAAVATMSFVTTQQPSDADYGTGDSQTADRLVRDAGLADPPSETILVTSDSGRLAEAAATDVIGELRETITPLDGVAGVGDPIWSEQRDAVLLPITMSGTSDDASDHIDPVLAATADAQEAHPDLTVEQAGGASIGAGITERIGEDLASAEMISLPITFLILLVAFGALIAAGIPVLLAFTSVLATLGLYAPLSYLVPDDGQVANVVLLIGMAVGVDYSLFYLKREREERQRGHRTVDAIEIAAATSGRAVVVSGFAVMVAMSGLYLTRDVVFAGLATGSILVVAVAVLGSLTVLPALLAKLGHWVDRPRVPLLWRMNRRIGSGGISRRLLGPVVSHPRGAAVGATVVLVALAAPILGMKLHSATLETLPQDIPAVQAIQHLQESFPAERPEFAVVVDAPAGDAAAVTAALGSVAQDLDQRGLATTARREAVRVSDDHRTHLLTLSAAYAEGDPRNDETVELLRDTVVPRAVDMAGGSWVVGGDVAASVDQADEQRAALPWVVAFVLVLTLLMMGWMFRSIMIAALTTLLNLLSVGAAFGVMTLVFQNSWAESLLDFQSSGFLIDWVPLFCFVILVGLSMDYHVFVLSRVRERLRNGEPHAVAVRSGIEDTASVVTSAAAVMISVFAVFATLSMMEMKQMGVGLAVAILVDATVVRLVLLPALLLIFERQLTGLARQTTSVEATVEPQPALVR